MDAEKSTSDADAFVIAFRTHLWNEDVAHLARRMFSYSVGARFVILADESNGVLDTAPFEKISHGNDFSDFGLPNFPQHMVLWYNADYPLYVLRRAIPGAVRYAMIEFDVAVNIDLTGLLRHCLAHDIDLISHEMENPPTWWYWNHWVSPKLGYAIRHMLPVLVLSARGIDAMLARRLEICAEKWPEEPVDWPYCEAYIPTAIAEVPGFKLQNIKDHAQLLYYDFKDAIHLVDPRANTIGAICHPVLGGKALPAKLYSQNDIETIFDPESHIRKQLVYCDPAVFFGPAMGRIEACNKPELVTRFMELAAAQNWLPAAKENNLARGRPAMQSSTCAYSRHWVPAEDAAGGNNGVISGGFGFHTDFEVDPWWQVDLGGMCRIDAVIVYNRLEQAARCTRLAILGSADGEVWTAYATKLDDSLFGGADGKPYKAMFEPPVIAHYVRVQMIGEGILHLDEIEVFGSVV